jgi:acyl-CoA synthetase (AMP-forming)/AMP-acid ligase II
MTVPGSNVARHLRQAAAEQPDALATLTPLSIGPDGKVVHARCSFRRLDQESDAAARIFHAEGIAEGTRALLAVRPGHDLIVAMFGLLKLGAVPIAIDPGMGWPAFLRCVRHTEPEALVGVRAANWLSRAPLPAFRSLRTRIDVGTAKWRRLRSQCTSSDPRPLAELPPEAPAAILFTSGSTGAPKGVDYTHGMFDAQIDLIRRTYAVQPGEIDMPMLPLFALFNPALRVTTVTPLLDPSRPAAADPAPIVAALLAEKVTMSFGSPAIWGRLADHCERRGLGLPSLRRVLIAGAPVPDGLLAQLGRIAPQAQVHTPYGATECLPVSTIGSGELRAKHAEAARRGFGTCVGRAVDGVTIRVIREVEGPIRTLADATACAPGEVGEIIATGPSVTRAYHRLPAATAAAKIAEGGVVWHRMGDLGTLDADGLLRFLGRRAEKVRAAGGDLPTEAVEPAFRTHPDVARCALIGLGVKAPFVPALVVEPRAGRFPADAGERERFIAALRACARGNAAAERVETFLFQAKLPVDVRHNAKIHRLRLAQEWTARLRPGRLNPLGWRRR